MSLTSGLRYQICIYRQVLVDIFTIPKSEKILPTLSEVGRHPAIKMAASYKPEVLISQKVNRIATKFQMERQCFGVGYSNYDIPNNIRLPLTSKIVGDVAIGLPDSENIVFAFGIRCYLVCKLRSKYFRVDRRQSFHQ